MIAQRLGKFAYEVEDLSLEEFHNWEAYFELQQEAQKKTLEEQKRKSNR